MQAETGYELTFTELALDTPKVRAALQRNEDKIEEFNKWSENMVRFVQSILEEAESKYFNGDSCLYHFRNVTITAQFGCANWKIFKFSISFW